MEDNGKPKTGKRGKKLKPGPLILIFLTGFLLICFIGVRIYQRVPSKRAAPAAEFYDLSPGRLHFVYGDRHIPWESPPLMLADSHIYLPVDFITEFIDPYIFWDEPIKILTVTTPHMVIRLIPDEPRCLVNSLPHALEYPMLLVDGAVYLPEGFLSEFYSVSVSAPAPYGVVTVDSGYAPRFYASVHKKTSLRYEPHIKSPIAESLDEGDVITVFPYAEEEPGEPALEGFIKARSQSGIIGYVQTVYLNNIQESPPAAREPEDNSLTAGIDGKIVLLWDQVFRKEDNMSESRVNIPPVVNVLSPTWFSFDEERLNGDIISLADRDYVDRAHAMGVQVWALISDNFKYEVSHAVLTSTLTRIHVIEQLMDLAEAYNLDGINIDFENVAEPDARHYLQFFRELRPYTAARGLILSVDMFVPLYTRYLNRAEVAKAVDYICVMTYDEHHITSPISGPVASLPFVEQGISQTLEEVPKEKVIMGLPFYLRIWREIGIPPNVTVSSSATNLTSGYNRFLDNGAEFQWLPDIGSYYGEYTAMENGDEARYRLWLENTRSIGEKMNIFHKYDLAGIACWKRLLETEDVWDMIEQALED